MDKDLLKKYFRNHGLEVEFTNFSKIKFRGHSYQDEIFIYTSSEDVGYHYKDYIEDIVYALNLSGARVIPAFQYLRANNNKVFMEFLRDMTNYKDILKLQSSHFGTFEELKEYLSKDSIDYPVVIKSAEGATSSGVSLAKDKRELLYKSKKVSRNTYRLKEILDLGRKLKHKGYKLESKYREKFIIQQYIPELDGDWKIYFFGKRLFIWYRYVRRNDFRASGSGKFLFNEDVPMPEGLLDFALNVYKQFHVPFISIDIAFDGNDFFLLEIQFVYFGKNGHYYSRYYYEKIGNQWTTKPNKDDIEKVYADSVIEYIERKGWN